MIARTQDEIDGLLRAGALVAAVRDAVCDAVCEGVSTLELDRLARGLIEDAGATSAPREEYEFPGWLCLSTGEVAVHGIPNATPLVAGELVRVDVTLNLQGFVADSARTVGVGPVGDRFAELVRVGELALEQAVAAAVAGAPLHAIGSAVDGAVAGTEVRTITRLCGHGLGRSVHEAPDVPNTYRADCDEPLTEGLVIAIEPILTLGSGEVYLDESDGWSIRTSDGAPVVHSEHTVLVRAGSPLVITR